jgi:large subunit ribosomal protein L23
MSAVQLILRRCYATKSPKTPVSAISSISSIRSRLGKGEKIVESPAKVLPVAAAVARRTSTPMAVRIRRIKANRDQIKAGLTASEEDTYGRLRSQTNDEDFDSPTLWAKTMHERRARIRGLKEAAPDDNGDGIIDIGEGMGYGNGRVNIVGQRIYLPNFVVQLIRNRTPLGKPYNPYEAAFRIPKNLTKHDLRSYLYFVYGVKTTYIRTDNYIGAFKRLGHSRTKVRRRGGTYKRAVVGLVDPFYPPDMLEDMDKPLREAAKKKLWEEFSIDRREELREEQRQMLYKPRTALGDKPSKRAIPDLVTSRAKIMQKVLEKRKERTKMIQEKVGELMKQNPIRLRV